MTPQQPESSTAPRRTQAQRRDATIGRLVEATVRCLTTRGYAATSTAAICAEAGVSQGALFRHFPTRQALLVATAEHVAQRQVEAFAAVADQPVHDVAQTTAILLHLRTVVLSPANQTWRELLVAARSEATLREAMQPARQRFQQQMLDTAAALWADRVPAADQAAVLSLVVNYFDGLAFSSLDPDPTATPGRTVERAVGLLAEMIVRHYGPTDSDHQPAPQPDPQEQS